MTKYTQDKHAFSQAEHKEDNETAKSLQFCKMKRQKSENFQKWIKRLRLVAKECKYQEIDRWVKEQFICGINDEDIKKEK